MSQNHMAGDTP